MNDETDLTAGTTGTTWTFTYDLGGNILTKNAYVYTTGSLSGLDPTESHTYTYDTNWKDKLFAYDGVTIQYDAIGNPTNDGTWQYTWQHGRQLQQMKQTDNSKTVSFEYNEDGLRTKKTVVSGNSTTVTEYTLHGKNVVHLTRGNDVLHFYYDAQNRLAIVIFNGTAYGYLYNLQGDVVALVDGSGTKVVEYTYDAWGKPTGKTGTMASTLGTVQPFRYRRYVFDEETGLYYLKSRYYNSGWGRFVIADSLIKGSLYIYCNNNPITNIDPDGNETKTEDKDRFIDKVRELTKIELILPQYDWEYMTYVIHVKDGDIRNNINIMGSILLSAGESWLFTKLIQDPKVGAVVGLFSQVLKLLAGSSLKEQYLNTPNGIYTVESVSYSQYDLFSQSKDIYELIYGYTNNNFFYVDLWHVRTDSCGVYSSGYTNVIFEGTFIKEP